MSLSEFGSTSVGKNRNTADPNKGHHTFDSKERTENFYKTLSLKIGLKNTKTIENNGMKTLKKKRNIPEYPLCIDLELSSACNLSCPMCYTTTDHFKKNVTRKNMNFPLIKKIIDEVAGKTNHSD